MAMERFHDAVPASWSNRRPGRCSASRSLPIVMRDRLPRTTGSRRSSGRRSAIVVVGARGGAVRPARQRRDALARLRRRSACSRPSSRRSPSSSSSRRCSSGAWTASTTSAYSLLPIGVVLGVRRRADPARAGSRHGACRSSMIAAVMVFAAGHQLPLRRRRCCSRRCRSLYPADRDVRLPAAAGHWRSSIRGAIRSATASR